ncbi:hypothetical protein [Pilimelia columellifera]|uniref:Uncharacterized protein n=1 Tax=Pilimelia columellifera subsp. columellifera TaxID=706583 RepID=A0ABN3N137_9ACTN
MQTEYGARFRRHLAEVIASGATAEKKATVEAHIAAIKITDDG